MVHDRAVRPSRLRVVVALAGVVLLGLLAVVIFSGEPTNRTLTIEGSDGPHKVCASSQSVVGDDAVELGGAFVAGPQWLEAEERVTRAPLVAPDVGVTLPEFQVTFVAEDGSVISQQRGGSEPIASPAPWSAALVEKTDEQWELTSVTAEEGC